VATGLIGFLGLRERMRESTAFSTNQPETVSRSTRQLANER
jgi:hypothetical protein